MKQIIQRLDNGETDLLEVPAPCCKPGSLLIQTEYSLISAGTERMLVNFGKSSYLQKARSQPDKVKEVLRKVKTDGLFTTIDAVKSKLGEPLPLGYCNVGRVLEVGKGVSGFQVGDRVASNGHHAEVVCVPVKLCAKIPEGLENEQAVYTVIGSIALQGLRLAEPTLGETVVVTGLGLVGLMAVQLLRANGCRVIGLDYNQERCAIAESYGALTVKLGQGEDPIAFADKLTEGVGVDAVLITASTKSSEPIHQAAVMCRKRGRIVMVGVTGMELSRSDFYEKELTFQVSCSYGPGRYDADYEDRGQDYPVGFVRWTEQRNFEAVLQLMAQKKLDTQKMTSHHFEFSQALDAYAMLNQPDSLGILMAYPATTVDLQDKTSVILKPNQKTDACSVGFIGAGNFASRVLIPAFKKAGANLQGIASSQGLSGTLQAKKHGFSFSTTDFNDFLKDDAVDAVVIATRHSAHAGQVIAALEAGKHVFVEKPLALNIEQLEAVRATYESLSKRPVLMVGFNRRFAPQIQLIKKYISPNKVPVSMVMSVNAGAIPASHWTQDVAVGGGRIIGEGCHFIDLLRYLADSPIIASEASYLGKTPCRDTCVLTLTFENGSVGVINYFSNGNGALAKERLEVFSAGRVLQLDNFRKLHGLGVPGFKGSKLKRQDKGHQAEVLAFVEGVKQGVAPISFEELYEVSKQSILLSEKNN